MFWTGVAEYGAEWGWMQRFLTDARWDDELAIGWLQTYLGPRLTHPRAIWVPNGSDVPKQGRK